MYTSNVLTVCAVIFTASQLPSPELVMIEMWPSELPQASISPYSWGAKQTELTVDMKSW